MAVVVLAVLGKDGFELTLCERASTKTIFLLVVDGRFDDRRQSARSHGCGLGELVKGVGQAMGKLPHVGHCVRARH